MTQEQREWNKKLVAALRSGEYRQGQRKLRDGDKFCCLGVATDLACKAGLQEWDEAHINRNYPSSQVVKLYGWENSNPKPESSKWNTFADWNDAGKTFTELADLFEQTYCVEKETKETV